MLAEAKEKGLPVTLQLLAVNPVRRLYERLGFKISKRSAHHLHMTWRP